MKLTDQTIIDSARRQRDATNEQLTVRPWTGDRHRFHMPLWLVSIPAAALIGFFFGTSIRQSSTPTSLLTAKADTVYITREVPVPQKPDTVVRYVTRKVKSQKPAPAPNSGRPVGQDDIDYSMLVLK